MQINSALKKSVESLLGYEEGDLSDDPRDWENHVLVLGLLTLGANSKGIASAPASVEINSSTPTQVFAENGDRISALISNTSEVNIYLGSSGALTASNGILLKPGQSFEDTLTTGAWFAIAESGTLSIPVLEVASF